MNTFNSTAYQRYKETLLSKQRCLQIFEYRNGLVDGGKHTYSECGKQFGVSSSRIRQLEEKYLKDMAASQSNRVFNGATDIDMNIGV